MSYADPQEFYPHVRREDVDFYNKNDLVENFDRNNARQHIYTIPGYIAYSMSRKDACTPCDVSINLKGEDNLAFHAHEQSSQKTVPPLPLRHTVTESPYNPDEKVYTPSSQSTDATLEKKTRFRWTLKFIRTEAGDRRSFLILGILVLAILLLLAAVGVVLYLTVGGGLEHFVSSKSELHTDFSGDDVLDGTFRISSVAYDADLANSSSTLYDILRREISQAVNSLFTKSSISQQYNRSDILNFRNGSVVVDVKVFLDVPLVDATAKVTSAFVKGLVNMHGTVLLDKFVIDIRSIIFKVAENVGSSSSSHPLSSTDENHRSSSTIPGDDIATLPDVAPKTTENSMEVTARTSSAVPEQSPVVPSSSTSMPPAPSVVVPHRSTTTAAVHPMDVSTTTVSTTTTTTTVTSQVTTPKTEQPVNNNPMYPPRIPRPFPSVPPFVPTSISVTLLSHIMANGEVPKASLPSSSTVRPSSLPPFFLRPPLDRTRPYLHRHSRPTLPAHLETDFADSPGWGPWASWSPCGGGAGQCESGKNDTQTRTRDCRSRSGRGEVLSDARECLKRGGVRLDSRKCQCPDNSSPRIHSVPPFSPFSAPAGDNMDIPKGRPCHECTAEEICLAKHSEKDPICRKPKDATDPTECGGWCDPKYEYCQHMSTGARKCIDDRVCLPDEWQCGDGLCIPLDKRCDGHFNCYDTTDEMNCKCDETQFRCGKNTSCLPLYKRCNQIVDCWDGSDEENCTKQCPNGKFTCNNGQCIPNIYFCDGLIDCSDSSDEPEGCNSTFCISGEFRCSNGRCIKQVYVCDGSDTCGDGSDEQRNCSVRPATATAVAPAATSWRPSDSFKMIMVRRDVKLLRNCSREQFQCLNGVCVEQSVVCDRKDDCGDASDEKSCFVTSEQGSNNDGCVNSDQFSCSNGKCIERKNICDSVDHCGDSSDETVILCQHQRKEGNLK